MVLDRIALPVVALLLHFPVSVLNVTLDLECLVKILMCWKSGTKLQTISKQGGNHNLFILKANHNKRMQLAFLFYCAVVLMCCLNKSNAERKLPGKSPLKKTTHLARASFSFWNWSSSFCFSWICLMRPFLVPFNSNLTSSSSTVSRSTPSREMSSFRSSSWK